MAWAILLSDENINAILSEAGTFPDRKFIEDWRAKHGEGYFLRDESSVLDCSLFTTTVFLYLYEFDHADESAMFRQVTAIPPAHIQE